MAKKITKILAIDDHIDNLVVLKALVNDSFPAAVFIAADSGRKGFELCQTEIPDVILLDIVMPGMDGYEVCQKIKSDLRLKHIPVVMVTANRADKESRVKALDAGADAFLPKPVDDSELKAQIRAMLRIKESEDQKKEEKHRLEDMVLDRTEALENELADRKKAENKLIQSLDKITKNRQAIMNLMEDLRVEIEERKLIENNLKEERNLLRTVIDNIHDTIYVFDKEGRKIIANKADVEITGCQSEADVIGKTDLENYPGEIGQRFYNDSMLVIKTGKPKIDFEEKFISKSGEIRYLTTTKYPLYDTDGQITGLVGIGHDITKSKRAQDELKESYEFNNSLLKTIPFGMDIVSEDGTILFQSDGFRKLFGDIPIGSKCWELYRDDKKQCSECPLIKGIKIGITENYESRGILGDKVFDISYTGILFHGKKAMLEIFIDITGRKQMEEKIIESETYYRTLVDISPDGIIIADFEGNVTYGSIKAFEIFGVPPGQNLTGTSILSWLAPDSQEAIMERMMDIINGNIAPETNEYRLKKFDGTIFWGELSSSPISDAKGNIASLIIVCRDITERKNAETELIRSKEKAEESDRLKTAFLHNISHEIRTPMNAIIGFSALLSEPDLDKESHNSFIETITQSSNQLLSIVNDIIEISNIEAGILKLNLKSINLNSVLGNLQNRFSPLALQKNVEFIIDTGFTDGEAQVWTDETKLSQILSSLLSNAFKFTSKGNITLGYRLKGNIIEFVVSDTGIGIPKEHFNKIFERFYQIENTLDRQYEGTGIGLSIAKAYVELLGGKIWLTSEPGSGTTFMFTIPYSSAEHTFKKEMKPRNEDVKKYENKTVLIAEDEEDNYRLLAHFLSGLNLKLIHAENGKKAVDICDSNEYIDLVLMDIRMPVMDGLEATTVLKMRRPSLPVIAQTAFAFESERDKVFNAGCDDYLAKPIKKDLLVALVKKYLYPGRGEHKGRG